MMTSGRLPLALALLATASLPAQSSFIYGIHDFEPRPDGYLARLEAGGARGYVTATEAVGHNPGDRSGKDYRSVSSRGHTVIARLNNGYGSAGTIPLRSFWDDFAKRCASFAAASQGCSIWVIGNETNLSGEWPAEANGYRRYISPEDYADCFGRVYDAIKAVRPAHLVIPQALAPFAGPYGATSTHDGNPIDHITYMRRMLDAIRAPRTVDGIALHINSRGYERSDVFSTAKVNGNYWSFFCYKDWLERGTPRALWGAPVFATECNGYYFWKGGHPEDPAQTYVPGWVQTVLLEIDRWNHNEAVVDGKPAIRCVDFYRWCGSCDGWNIDASPQKAQILGDLDEAVKESLRWDSSPGPLEPPFTVAIGRKTPLLDKGEAPYLGVWRSYVFSVSGTEPTTLTFALEGAAQAGADDDDARLLVDDDDPADGATWNATRSLDGARDQGATRTVSFNRTLSPGRHVLRLQVDGSPLIQEIRVLLPEPPEPRFRRGDANADGKPDISDAVATLGALFLGQGGIGCQDAADSNDDGKVDISDAVNTLGVLFLGQGSIPPPGGEVCGVDPSEDEIDCGAYTACP